MSLWDISLCGICIRQVLIDLYNDPIQQLRDTIMGFGAGFILIHVVALVLMSVRKSDSLFGAYVVSAFLVFFCAPIAWHWLVKLVSYLPL